MRDPMPTYTKRETERISGISLTRTRSPLGRVTLRYSIDSERYQSVAMLAADHHGHIHRVGPAHRADADTPEVRIHDVRAVIDGLPRFIHELDMQRVHVVVPDLAGVLPVPACAACRNIARARGPVRTVVIDVADLRS